MEVQGLLSNQSSCVADHVLKAAQYLRHTRLMWDGRNAYEGADRVDSAMSLAILDHPANNSIGGNTCRRRSFLSCYPEPSSSSWASLLGTGLQWRPARYVSNHLYLYPNTTDNALV